MRWYKGKYMCIINHLAAHKAVVTVLEPVPELELEPGDLMITLVRLLWRHKRK